MYKAVHPLGKPRRVSPIIAKLLPGLRGRNHLHKNKTAALSKIASSDVCLTEKAEP